MSNEERFEQNQKLVYYIIGKNFANMEKQKEDILQTGMLGLWKACLNYQEGQNKFSTFACKCIKNEIVMFLRTTKHDGKVCQFSQLDECVIDALAFEPEFEIEEFKKYLIFLTPKEKDLFARIARGQQQTKIAKEYGVTKQAISKNCIELKQKILKLRNKEIV